MKRRKEHGVVSIEVAIGIFPLLLMFFAWMEISYMGYVSSLVDYAISEGARQSKAAVAGASEKDTTKINYGPIFKSVINNDNSLWSGFVDLSKFKFTNFHYKNIVDLDKTCNEPEECNLDSELKAYQAPIAVYQLSYEYNPIFGVFIRIKQ